MGRIITPKYRLEMEGPYTNFIWSPRIHGKPNPENIEKYLAQFTNSMRMGGVNEKIGQEYGIRMPSWGRIVDQFTQKVVAEWRMPPFYVL